MLLSAALRNIILLPLVFLTGVWVGQSWLDEQQSDGQDKPREAEIRRKLEQRMSSTCGSEISAKKEDNHMDHFGNEPPQEFSDMTDVIDPSNESGSESYSFYQDVALNSSAIEPSPQSIENDIARSLEEAEIPPEEIPGRVENVMGMIMQQDQQAPEDYPNISPDTEVPCKD